MSLDLQLFVEQAGWLAPRLDDPSRLGVMTWLGRRLAPDARRRFLRHFPLAHAAQERGEAGLCALLSRSIVVHPSKLVRSDDIGRTIDWAETYTRARGGLRPPQPFLARVRHPIPDRATLGALVTLGRSWKRLLALAEGDALGGRDYAARRSALGRALAPQLLRGVVTGAFGSRHAARLRRLDAEAAADVAAIEEALVFWRRAFGEHDVEALGTVGRALDDADARNIDTLMEATVALSIARAGVEAPRADWPTLFPWRVDSVDDPKGMYPAIVLRSGDLLCEISKGTPPENGRVGQARGKVPDLLSPWADEALPATGRARSSGRQPDVVVSFWFEGAPDRTVFALGDAKRNATGDGEGYIRTSIEVAATYLMSFGHRMGHVVPGAVGGGGGGAAGSAAGGGHATSLMPGVTLFCRQGTGCDPEDAVKRLRADKAPVVMAFDLERHLGLGASPWGSPVLSAWLGSLGRQAVQVLGGSAPRRRRARR